MKSTGKMNNKTTAVIFGILILIFAALAFSYRDGIFSGRSEESGVKPVIKIAASFYPLYYFSQRIANNKGDVVNITPAGSEPHDYEPTARDIAGIENSDVLVLNGGGLEAWGEKIKGNVDSRRTIVIEAGEGLADPRTAVKGGATVDPHVWLSPKLAERMADKILQGFIQADKNNAGYYTANANTLKAELETLDTEFAAGLRDCADRSIVTSHAAFGYLASAYNLNQVAIAGLSPDAEPSPKELADITKFARENNVTYIFFERLASPKLSRTVADEIGAKTLVLNPLEGLDKKELAEGKNYFTEMRNNLANLRIALQCAR